jgi:hypothetical protein
VPEPNHIEILLTEIKESLERETAAPREVITTPSDTQAARSERHAALIQTEAGTSRMKDWAEKVDRALETKDQQIAALTKRIEQLEGNRH